MVTGPSAGRRLRPVLAFAALAVAVDLGTVLPFALLHQALIGVTWGPFFAVGPALLPAAAVAGAWWLSQRRGFGLSAVPAASTAAGMGLVSWGAGFGLTDTSTALAAVLAVAGCALGTLLVVRSLSADWVAAGAWAVAAGLAFGMVAPFLAEDPVRWVHVRALAAFSASVLAGGFALALAGRALARRGLAPAVPT